MSFIRQTVSRSLPRVRTPAAHTHRSFATSGPSGQQGTPRWLLVSIALGVPISIYMWTRDTAPKTSPRGVNQEYKQGRGEGSESNGSSNHTQDTNTASDYDKPRGMGSPAGPGSMSHKQEGWSNADSMNPYINEPGKSKKGEGETETVKVKGTVRVDRPQV
ncbi:unnamed protein product [Penicillium olsonii]|nr:unnamed protein product [Penicillium olsonii]